MRLAVLGISLALAACGYVSHITGDPPFPDLGVGQGGAIDLAGLAQPPDLSSGPNVNNQNDLSPTVVVDLAQPIDLIAPADLTPPSDMTPVYQPTAHDIDVNQSGKYPKATAVRVSGLTLITPIDKFYSHPDGNCRYQAWAQDAACVTPPCGISVIAIGPAPPTLDAGTLDCPSAAASGSLLANVSVGDTIDLDGFVSTIDATSGGLSLRSHGIVARTLTKVAARAVTPTVLTDGALFTSYSGAGWVTYEGMLVKLQPATKISVTTTGSLYFHTDPGNSALEALFVPPPAVGHTYSSITAAVSDLFGGALLPRSANDFVP